MAQKKFRISSESLSSDDSFQTSSDESSGLGRRKIPTKPVIQSNKLSTFLAKNNYDNEETPLKQTHEDAFPLKQENSKGIKRLHINCGFLDNEHVFMLPKTSLKYQQYEDVHVEITQNLYNAYSMTKSFFVEKYFEIWDPQIHSPRTYIQIFYVAYLIEECGTKKHYPL